LAMCESWGILGTHTFMLEPCIHPSFLVPVLGMFFPCCRVGSSERSGICMCCTVCTVCLLLPAYKLPHTAAAGAAAYLLLPLMALRFCDRDAPILPLPNSLTSNDAFRRHDFSSDQPPPTAADALCYFCGGVPAAIRMPCLLTLPVTLAHGGTAEWEAGALKRPLARLARDDPSQ
jgi:hypothetical protein